MTQATLRHQRHNRPRRGLPPHERRRRGAEPVQIAPREEAWGDMCARHRRERHEAHLRTAEALNDLDQAVRRADRWCDALAGRLDLEEHRMAKVRATLLR